MNSFFKIPKASTKNRIYFNINKKRLKKFTNEQKVFFSSINSMYSLDEQIFMSYLSRIFYHYRKSLLILLIIQTEFVAFLVGKELANYYCYEQCSKMH